MNRLTLKGLTAFTLAIAWLAASAAPMVASRVSAPETLSSPEAECAAGIAQSCGPDHTVTSTVVEPNGDVVVTTRTCKFTGVVTEAAPGGGVNVYCDYGNCGRVLLTPA